MDQNKIAEYIIKKRKEKGLTQKDVATKLHVSVSAVSKWERGLSYPDITLLEPLSLILDTSMVELLKGEDLDDDLSKYEAHDLIKELVSINRMKEYKKKALISDVFYVLVLFVVVTVIICLYFFQIIETNKLFTIIVLIGLLFLGIFIFKNYKHSIYGGRFNEHFKDKDE